MIGSLAKSTLDLGITAHHPSDMRAENQRGVLQHRPWHIHTESESRQYIPVVYNMMPADTIFLRKLSTGAGSPTVLEFLSADRIKPSTMTYGRRRPSAESTSRVRMETDWCNASQYCLLFDAAMEAGCEQRESNPWKFYAAHAGCVLGGGGT